MSLRCVPVLLLLLCFAGYVERSIAIPPSETGQPNLHAHFLEARARMNEPYILAGEDVERLYFTFRDQLHRLGDERFAAALSTEPPDVVAAVASFIDFASLGGHFPQTRHLCSGAPKIDFPAKKATEDDRQSK